MTDTGVSGIPCVGLFTRSSLGLGKAFAEEDGELRFGHGPFTWRHDPRLLGTVQHQEQQFDGCIVSREVAACLYGPAQLGIQSLDGVGRVEDPAHLAGKDIERGVIVGGTV